MNVFPEELRGYRGEYVNSYLSDTETIFFNYLDKYVDNSFTFSLTFWNHESNQVLYGIDFSSYDYIFMLDFLDPPDYLNKWDEVYNIFKEFSDKCFVISYPYKNPYFKTLHFDHYLHFYSDFSTNKVFPRHHKKKFLSYNGRPHTHRVELLKYLHEKDLYKDGYVSGRLDKDTSYSDDFKSLFPMTLKNDVSIKMQNKLNNQIKITPYNYSAPVNIVTETSINHEHIFCTEKLCKSIVSKQLTMLIGSPLTYKYLTSTYGLYNYGFDFEPRIADLEFKSKIKYYCDFLKETSLNDLVTIYREKEDLLEHNKNKVLKEFKQISYNLFLTSLKKHRIIHL